MKTPALFNPQPAAQANRRSADFFKRCLIPDLSHAPTRNDNPATAIPTLCSRFTTRRGETMIASASFNPQPAAQANRRPADFFKSCLIPVLSQHPNEK